MNTQSNKAHVISLGCSKNLVDSEQLLYQLQRAGYQVSHNSDHIEEGVVIINTCGFIQDAKEESIETILEYAQAREEGIIERLYVFGCLSQRYAEELKAEIPEVDAFYGKFDWHHILEDLGSEYCMEERHRRILTTPAHYAFVKISEGCNRHCAYCAIPLITGRHRSRPMEDIVQEVKELVTGGVKEVQLIAQDLSYYGKDLYGRFNLAELMEKLSDIEGLEWLRLHYTYPHLFPMDILKVMRERKNICHYLDMAFQHCSDHMLQQMRRHINAEESYQLIEAIRKEVPDIHLRTTLMVGHPGETEEDFEALKTFVQKVRFERMGAFSFSSEEGTYSGDHYQDDVAQEVKEARLDELMALQHNISEEINQEKVGKCLKVIIDREEEDYYIARSEFDSPEVDPEIFIDKTKKLNIGSFYQARITQADTYDLFAEIVENQ
ncbi:MAG: 30S ribosomal protein S12 methylthiotransferase RimO [Bacteroidales bacterium]|nr:30S ribosomal protein S12 methylthiotransferase RimO [Bacteroidales bacterium]